MTEDTWGELARYPLWHERPDEFEAVLAILTSHDPLGICVDENRLRETEYSPEANTILPRLGAARSLGDVRAKVHEEFARWFDVDTTGRRRYDDIAAEIRELVKEG